MQIGIRELRRDLAAVVRRAAAGEPVVVTVAGAPVARLGTLDPSGGATLEDLVSVRAVVPPRRPGRRTRPATVDIPVDARTDRAIREIR